jgi:hypothetical protein
MIFVRSAFFFNERYWLSQDDAYCDERLEIQEILQGTRMQSFSFSFFWMIPSVVIKPAVKKRHCHLLQQVVVLKEGLKESDSYIFSMETFLQKRISSSGIFQSCIQS